jgi:hypothetical protein
VGRVKLKGKYRLYYLEKSLCGKGLPLPSHQGSILTHPFINVLVVIRSDDSVLVKR